MVITGIVAKDHYNSSLHTQHPVVTEEVEDMLVLQSQPFSGRRRLFLFRMKIKRQLSTGLRV